MKITAAHGSGGRDSARLMETVFGRRFANAVLDKMEDAAALDLHGGTPPGRLAVSTDSFVVSPLVFKGGDIGKLSVCGTVNDLLMMGAVPRYLTCGFILEEGLEIALLDRLAASMAETAAEAGVLIVAGDTKVAGTGGGLYVNTAGIGLIPAGRAVSASACKPGDAVLLSGTLGDHHACILSARLDIENPIESDCACLRDLTDALFARDIAVRAMRDVTRGGLGTILNELADSSGCAIELQEEKIPVSEAVRGFCGVMGLDPLYMGNEGKMVAVVDGADAEKALAAMRAAPHGRNAAVIGRAGEGRGVLMKTRLGGTRRVDVLYGEGLPRIC
ncbi:MAG: hydrogenase expression/formation protein HypE [Clostridiales Family XIII bacterium]|jgi:hydrogenase expression/formation protein HypE|nr:hydrogenase expression/formation protein HypE [Clostridiales Family XIII bacterium]